MIHTNVICLLSNWHFYTKSEISQEWVAISIGQCPSQCILYTLWLKDCWINPWIHTPPMLHSKKRHFVPNMIYLFESNNIVQSDCNYLEQKQIMLCDNKFLLKQIMRYLVLLQHYFDSNINIYLIQSGAFYSVEVLHRKIVVEWTRKANHVPEQVGNAGRSFPL